MHLQGNKFTGLISRALLNSSYLLTLDIRDNIFFGSIPDSIRLLSNLRILLFRGNQLSSSILIELCQLNKINLMELSNNFFNGSTPRCFGNITFGTIRANDFAFNETSLYSSLSIVPRMFGSLLDSGFMYFNVVRDYYKVDKVEFVTKSRSSFYMGNILDYMSGLNLSCNELTCSIPFELGILSSVHALNLSHNLLTGPIPKTFSNLTQFERKHPNRTNESKFLGVFTMAHNNFSGKILDRKAQFGTFEASSYEGNPFLCGPPLEKNCTAIVDSPHLPTPVSLDKTEGKWYDIDLGAFSASFVRTYITFLFGFAAILYINPYWRQRWFYLIEEGSIPNRWRRLRYPYMNKVSKGGYGF
ncbi:hypothetical protein HYC85_027748 [Camellia sinensis]|uniref:Uncharacterized protein n=1 Tax=Camellia sinensis TaxID=4442 RepID=A0A7J7FTZ3_CAMSI|nr:hypothetical protein HYC85_027748 [Camellia sinensis]